MVEREELNTGIQRLGRGEGVAGAGYDVGQRSETALYLRDREWSVCGTCAKPYGRCRTWPIAAALLKTQSE